MPGNENTEGLIDDSLATHLVHDEYDPHTQHQLRVKAFDSTMTDFLALPGYYKLMYLYIEPGAWYMVHVRGNQLGHIHPEHAF